MAVREFSGLFVDGLWGTIRSPYDLLVMLWKAPEFLSELDYEALGGFAWDVATDMRMLQSMMVEELGGAVRSGEIDWRNPGASLSMRYVGVITRWASQSSESTRGLLEATMEASDQIAQMFEEMSVEERANLGSRVTGILFFEVSLLLASAGTSSLKIPTLMAKLNKLPGMTPARAAKIEEILTQFVDRVKNLATVRKVADEVVDIGATGCFVAGTPVHITTSCLTGIATGVGSNQYRTAVCHDDSEVAVSIEDVRLGYRILAQNPDPFDVQPRIVDPATDNLYVVQIEFQHPSGSIVDADLLRSGDWIDRYQLRVGKGIQVWLTEIQTKGQGKVTGISEFKGNSNGFGALVTGRFRTRKATDLVTVAFADGMKLTGTSNHPVWSLSRNDWIGLSKLEPDEHVKSRTSFEVVRHVSVLGETQSVFNIEVDGQRVYEVTELGILVHNSGIFNCAEYMRLLARHADDLTPDEVARLKELKQLAAKIADLKEIPTKSLQKVFDKHAADFGLIGNWKPSRAADVLKAIKIHIGVVGTNVIEGTYRGKQVLHYVDPKTGLNVMTDLDGNFIGGWKLGTEQLKSVLTSGRLF